MAAPAQELSWIDVHTTTVADGGSSAGAANAATATSRARQENTILIFYPLPDHGSADSVRRRTVREGGARCRLHGGRAR